jgi:hypothetical protein
MRGCLLTHREKNRLVRFANNLGSALNELATIAGTGIISVDTDDQPLPIALFVSRLDHLTLYGIKDCHVSSLIVSPQDFS